MAQLVACCASADLTPEMAALRGKCYREDLSDLTDDAWAYAVRRARQQRWFPSVDELREFAAEARVVTGFLPPARRSAEEMETDRQVAAEGLKLIKAAVRDSVTETNRLSATPVKALPYEVRVADDRLEVLRKQAKEIL